MIDIKISSQQAGTFHDMSVTDAETGEEIRGLVSMDVHYRLDEPPYAQCQLLVMGDETACPAWFVAYHPVSGELKRIKRIEFQDGDEWVSEE